MSEDFHWSEDDLDSDDWVVCDNWKITIHDDEFISLGHDRKLTDAKPGDCFRHKDHMYHLEVKSVDGNQMGVERSWK